MNAKLTISCAAVAQILGTTHATVKELVKTKQMPGIHLVGKTGRDRIIIFRTEFEEYLGEKTEQKA